MPRSHEEFVEIMTTHLAEIAAGHCSVTREEIEGCEEDPDLAQILAGLMWLQEELSAREAAKNRAIVELEQTLKALEQQHLELLQSRALADELSTPIIRAARGVLLMPLIGTLDEARATLIGERVLDAIKRERARHVILDVTGLPAIEGSTARLLTRIATSARLLGARTTLAGLQPTVARSLAALDVDLGVLSTVQSFHEALQLAVAESDRLRRRDP
jgi:rsbT co-antagonist protein RsbR